MDAHHLRIACCILTAGVTAGCSHFERSQHGSSKRFPDLALIRAERACDLLANPLTPPPARLAAETEYRVATADFVRQLQKDKAAATWTAPWVWPPEKPRYLVRFDTTDHQHQTWNPAYFDQLTPAPLNVSNRPQPADPLRPQGVGAPLVAHRDQTALRKAADPDFPAYGINAPATALLEFDKPIAGTPRQATFRLYDPRQVQTVRVRGTNLPLAADFAAPANSSLGESVFKRLALGGLIWPEEYIQKRGLFMLEPYRPDKIPVVLVHGLNSDPHIWQNLVATLTADPRISARYQFWYFVYPTGLIAPSNAASLRKHLTKTREHYDPAHKDECWKHMVLVGHSMGGLLSRMQAVDSGDAFWNAYFMRPPGQMKMSADTQLLASKVLLFQHETGVDRVIFIATPHRGSILADISIGRLASRLIEIPTQTLSTFTHLMTLNPDALNPQLMRFRHLGATSIDTLSPGHPYLAALNSRPIQARYYSIIGDRGRNNTPNSSDGVVPYASSHLDGAASETIVPYGHSCVQKPLVIEQVRTILLAK